jgi:nitroimidazol reductase NimA-like FMN-containing flavoprotein (pyridoxamine 5'-phosphate oxidase superfamily)
MSRKKLDIIVPNTKIPIRIAFTNPKGTPSIISLWYEQIDSKIYCATQKSAKIVSYLRKNPVCGFEIASDQPPYKGSRGEGTVKILESRGKEILEILIEKYLGKKESKLSRYLKNNSEKEVVIEINPQKISNYDYSKRMKNI